MIGGGGRRGRTRTALTGVLPQDVKPDGRPDVNQVTHSLPLSAEVLLDWAFPNHLQLAVFTHSSETHTVSILDTDNRYLTFRLNRSLDHRWTLVPVAGFSYSDALTL